MSCLAMWKNRRAEAGKDIVNRYEPPALSAGEIERRIRDCYEDSEEKKVLISNFLKQEKISGSPNDFHNLSITFSREDDYENACNILEKGLRLFPFQVDLLADFLQNGLYCGRREDCEKYCEKLKSIPKFKWTWRGFSFLADYLIQLTNAECDERKILQLKNEALHIAEEYRHYFPLSEDTYLVLYDIYNSFNEKDRAEQILEEAVRNVPCADRASLQYANLKFEKGEYEVADETIHKCLKHAARTQQSINISYAYFLSGLCGISLNYDRLAADEKTIYAIYRDFQVARESGLSLNYIQIMEKQIRILEIKSGVFFDQMVYG